MARPLSCVPTSASSCILAVLVTVLVLPCTTDTTTDNSTLHAYIQIKTHLLSQPAAVYKVPPKVTSNDTVYVRVSFLPYQILLVNEAEMSVTVAASVVVEWDEPAFAWDPNLASGIESVSVSRDDVWTPILVNAQSIDSENILVELPPVLVVSSNGSLRTLHLMALKVSCSFDMEWYPFDEQRCHFGFIPFNAENAAISTVSSNDAATTTVQSIMGREYEWTCEEVLAYQVQAEIVGTKGSVKAFEYANFEVLMKRGSTGFYITNLIFPTAATALLTPGVFLIPAEAGEKISYLVSIFLSTTVFLSSVSNTMSKGSNGISRFNALILAIVINIVLVMLATVFVLRRFNQEQAEEEEAEEENEVEGRENKTVRPSTSPDTFFVRNHLGCGKDEPNNGGGGAKERTSNMVSTSSRKVPLNHESDAVSPALVYSRRLSFGLCNRWRVWRRGKRLSSSTLDWIFFNVFMWTSSVVYFCLMHVTV